MPSNCLVLCRPLLLLPSIFPSIRVFSSELALPTRWPKYWSFSFSIRPSNEYSGLISFRILTRLISLSPRDSQKSSPAPQFKSIDSLAVSLLYGPTLTFIQDYWKNHRDFTLWILPNTALILTKSCVESLWWSFMAMAPKSSPELQEKRRWLEGNESGPFLKGGLPTLAALPQRVF